MDKSDSGLRRSVRQTGLIAFFGVAMAGLVQLGLLGLERITRGQIDELVSSGVSTFIAMTAISIYRDRVFNPSRRMIYLAAAAYIVIGIVLWLSLSHR